MDDSVRIDRWLWAVRVFKTRSLASEACKKGYVFVGGVAVKSSRAVRKGETISVKKSPVTYSYLVKEIVQKRVGAKLVHNYMVDVTSGKEMEIKEMHRYMKGFGRSKGAGRPTKKERREIDRLKGW